MSELISDLPLTLADGIAVLDDPNGIGVFLRFTAPAPVSRHIFTVGDAPDIARFTCCHRYEPFWMLPKTGTKAGEVPIETQYLLAELTDGRIALFVPLIEGKLRASLQGNDETGLALVVETGDPAVGQTEITGLFVATGEEPFALIEEAAKSVAAHLGTTRLRADKPLPDFVGQFGWCTWDAFYQDVSQEKVREGLESFQSIGIPPRFLILDDGWQSERKKETGERRLTAFAANDKFPGDLRATVAMSKEEYDIETFLVWHAMNGYWGGVDNEALPGYEAVSISRQSSEGILHHAPKVDTYFGPNIGVVPPQHIYRFFQDYHRYLRAQGVDGVKVDSQASLETVARGLGSEGRVPLMQAYHEALEGSTAVHFEGNLINCMSCANEMLYNAPASNLTRTSTDFWPNKPESHGLHLYTNAYVSVWFGQFVHPDWDMFQSGHPMGAYHAAGRAVSGSPVYVSDKPGAHNPEILRKLVTDDGYVLRADNPGLPTRDCLFADPTKDDVLLKIWNTYDNNRTNGLIGVFNARYSEAGTEPITGSISPSDIPGLGEKEFAVYRHGTQELRSLSREDRWDITLAQLESEVFNIVPVQEGFAVIGAPRYYNSCVSEGDSTVLEIANGVEFVFWGGDTSLVAYSATPPESVVFEGAYDEEEALEFQHDPTTGRLWITLPDDGIYILRVRYASASE